MRKLILLALLFPTLALAGGKKEAPNITVRIHAEGLEREGPLFVAPVDLTYPKKRIYIRKVPIITEKDIDAIFPFRANDGSLGCTFKLDSNGRQKVEEHTVSERDEIVVALINGRVGSAMVSKKPIRDGVVTIPSGFSPGEILVLQSLHPTVGKEKEFESQKKKAMASLRKLSANQAKAQKKAKDE